MKRYGAPCELPEPDPEAKAHSARLEQLIREEMEREGGSLSFMRFMELALYAPGLGYYSGPLRKFGAEGDFVTAPEISPLFSRCLATQCHQVLECLDGGDILELGAGSGVMAADLLLELEELGCFPGRYRILELSANLRARQEETLMERAPHLAARVEWLDRLPETGLRGVVVANELLDAIPVQRVRMEPDGLFELRVRWEENRFVWDSAPASDKGLLEAVDKLQGAVGFEFPPGYTSEIGLAHRAWVRSLAETLDTGAILLIDYGYPRREFYHPQRDSGTLMCHYRHRTHPDPLILTGLQDITAHVDFTAIAESAVDAGLRVAGYTIQAYFLLANGLTAALDGQPPSATPEYLGLVNQVKKLTSPEEMGELFKVMALTRNLDIPLRGFALRDMREKL